MAASVRVILSIMAAWEVANDADMAENVRTASMMTRKSKVDIELYYGGDVVVLDSCQSRCIGINKIYILNPTVVAKLLQYRGSRVEHRDGFICTNDLQ